MPLSWNEIKSRAAAFSKEWEHDTSEDAEAKSFWDAVDLCYRAQPFASETKRIEFLFELYDKYTSGMFVKEKKKQKN